MMEDYGLVMDFLPLGRPEDVKREPTAYVIGERFFTLLEIVIKQAEQLDIGERIYIGREIEQRKKVERIKNRIDFNNLTGSAKNELRTMIKKIVGAREKEFVGFLNKCGPITIRRHQLELLPGIGKKHLTEILEKRELKPFESFDDVIKRVSHLQNPTDIFTERVIAELQGTERYYLFTRPPFKEERRW